MNKTDYTETVKLIQKMVGTSAFVYGVVTAFRGENRTIKAEIQLAINFIPITFTPREPEASGLVQIACR